MKIKQKLLVAALVFGYICGFMIVQDIRSNNHRNLKAGDGLYERKDEVCS